MPNWCSNIVEVTHADRRKIVELRRAYRKGEMCNYIYPVPQELKDTVSGYLGDSDEQAKLEAQTRANVEKYGYGNWYDFCTNEWSTKWDVGSRGSDTQTSDNSLSLRFDSAWSPPIGIYEKMIADRLQCGSLLLRARHVLCGQVGQRRG